MQDEVNEKTIALYIKTGKLTAQTLQKAMKEVYFRGIIPKYLRKEFSVKGVILFSAIIFGIEHIATAFTARNGFEVCLTIFNAFLFGWLAIEIELISKSIVPAILLHFFFDFETKIIAMDETALLFAECVRGVIVFAAAVWLATVIRINLDFQKSKEVEILDKN